MTKWDYRIIGIKTPSTQSAVAELMARHGAEGWELVTIDFTLGWAYFKRQEAGLTPQAVTGLLEWIHFREGGGPVPSFLHPDRWFHVQERLPPDRIVRMVKLENGHGTALGAYHHDKGKWHIWTPITGKWDWEPEVGTVAYWVENP